MLFYIKYNAISVDTRTANCRLDGIANSKANELIKQVSNIL